MQRELFKACIGILVLAVVIGWVVFGVLPWLRSDRDHTFEFQRRYWQERMETTAARDAAVGEPVITPLVEEAQEASAPVPRLDVRGRVLDAAASLVEDAVLEALADTGARVALTRDGVWQTAVIEKVRDVTLAIPSRALSTAPLTMEGTERWVRCNWTLNAAAAGPLGVLDAACIEADGVLRIDFRGRADLPDGTVISVALHLGERRLCAAEYTVSGARFEGVLTSGGHRFPSALYTVRVECTALAQPPEVRESMADDAFFETQLGVYVGDPAHTLQETADEAFELWTIQRRTAHLVRLFRHLRNAGLTGQDLPEEVQAGLARVFPGETPAVSDEGTFDVPAWRYWLDARFVPRLEEYAAILDARHVPRAPEDSMLVDGYLRTVRRWMRAVSLCVYEHAKLEYAFEDLEQIALAPEDEEAMLLEKLAAFEARLTSLHSVKRGSVPVAGLTTLTVSQGERGWRLLGKDNWEVEGHASTRPPSAVLDAALEFICVPVCLYVEAHPPPALGLSPGQAPIQVELEGDLGPFPHRWLRVGARVSPEMDLWYAQLDTDRAVFVCNAGALIALIEALPDPEADAKAL